MVDICCAKKNEPPLVMGREIKECQESILCDFSFDCLASDQKFIQDR